MSPYIVGAIIAQAVTCGGLCAYLANQKGHSTKAWFFVGLFFGVLGLIACTGLPVVDESPGVRIGGTQMFKQCPTCRQTVGKDASVCRYCQHKF